MPRISFLFFLDTRPWGGGLVLYVCILYGYGGGGTTGTTALLASLLASLPLFSRNA